MVSPARELTNRLVPYRTMSPHDKFDLIQKFVQEFLHATHSGNDQRLKNGFRVKEGRASATLG